MTLAIDYLVKDPASSIGLNIAINDFMLAWLRYTTESTLICHTSDQVSGERFCEMAKNAGMNPNERCSILDPLRTPEALQHVDCLFVPDPDMSKPLWRRAQIGAKHALCGLVHSMSGEQVNRVVADLCVAPSHKTDALICPSIAIKDSVMKLWEVQSDYLAHRFGTPVSCPVQTPVIPIGIHVDAFAEKVMTEKRIAQREILGCAEDEVVILFIGRLNFATKAHPLPLILAAREAARQTKKKVRLIFYGYYMPKEAMEPRFKEIINDFSDDLNCEIIENTDKRFPDGLLAAADIFTSLVDNIQESFGLTPIEAMACGLPTVITDWDGYRDGVRDGIDGFLVPTYTPPVDAGIDIANHYLSDNNYGNYLMGAAQSTVIDIAAATAAFLTLIDNPDMRREMGAAAKKRAAQTYDWNVIIPAYEKLWKELGERANAAIQKPSIPKNWAAITPSHPNPFRMFESFPTDFLSPDTRIKIEIRDEDIALLLKHDMNYFIKELLAPKPLILTLIETIRAHGSIAISDILAIAPATEHQRLWRTIGWFLKHGICTKVS